MFGKNKKRKNSTGKVRRARVMGTKKAQLKDRRAEKKNTRKLNKQAGQINWIKVLVVFLMACFLVFVFWVLLFSDVMKIKNISIIGEDNIHNDINQEVEVIKDSRTMGGVSMDNLLLFSGKKLRVLILENNQDIKGVRVDKIFPGKLAVTITKRNNLFLWRSVDGCMLLDEDGGNMKNIDCDNDIKNLLRICKDLSRDIKLQCQVVISDDDNTDKVSEAVVQDIINSGIDILNALQKTFYFEDDLILVVPSLISGGLRVKSERHGELWFAVKGDIKKQIRGLRAVLKQKINIDDLNEMQYIDLRMENKIIYKFKEGVGGEELIIENHE